MTRRRLFLVLVGTMTGAFGCVGPGSPDPGIVSIAARGNGASEVIGFYVQDGRQVPMNETLPFTLTRKGITEVELRKADPTSTVTVAAQYNVQTDHYEAVSRVGPGRAGVRVRTGGDGLVLEQIKLE